MSAGRFAGKRILITGATSGMGRAGARRITREGGELVLTGSTPTRVDALRGDLPDAVVLQGDVTDPDLTARLVDAARGGLHGVWLNAGIAELGQIEQSTPEQFDQLIGVNVRAPFLQLAALRPALRPGASVVVTASSSVYEGAPVTGLYAATKAALVAAVRSWATQLAADGIRVNTLVPGAIDTDFRRFLDDDGRREFEQAVLDATPLGRAGTPDEAAAVALFLLSDDASYVTGSQYVVDGGLLRH